MSAHERGEQAAGAHSPEAVQRLLAQAVRLYSEQLEQQPDLTPFPADEAPPTPTAVLRTTSAMLDAVDVEVFELGMWNTWGTRGGGER